MRSQRRTKWRTRRKDRDHDESHWPSIRRLSFDYQGDDVNIGYDVIKAVARGRQTKRSMDRLKTDWEKANLVVEWLGAIITDWDILEDDSTPSPVSMETLRKLPLGLLLQIAEAVTEDLADLSQQL